MASFVVLDLETANADQSSICQIGAVAVDGDTIVELMGTYVDPHDQYFDPFNISIHGITRDMVKGAPRFSDALAMLQPHLADTVVVTHGSFDRIALARASQRYGATLLPELRWLDSQRVVRRTWPEFSKSGYALSKLVAHFGINNHRHHDALEDARATAVIMQKAIAASGVDAEGWLFKSFASSSSGSGSVLRAGDPDAPFAGEVIVFTGALTMPRKEAADAAARLGFNVADSVSKKITTLCVGLQDTTQLAGYDKSSKHRKAEELISEGHPIAIIGERDFMELVRTTHV